VSSHAHAEESAVPEFSLGAKGASIERISGVVGGLGLLLCVAGFFAKPAEFFQSYLFAFIYWGGFTFGGLGILLMNNTVGGKWGVTARRFLEAAMRTLPLIFVFAIVLLFGLKYLYPWTHADLVAATPVLQHKQPYLNTPFFIARMVIYFALLAFFGWRINRFSDEQDRTGDPSIRERMRRFSAPSLLAFVLLMTFALIDWVLSADPQFYSTVYAAMILIGDVLQTFALVITTMILTSKEDRFGSRLNSKILHDLGNLMFAFTIFWTYLSASQLIIVWPANLPQELVWYLNRVGGFWKWVTLVIALSMFAIPFLALLSQARKRNPHRLIKIAVWLLIARAIDVFWIVIPTYRNTGNFSLMNTSHGFALYWTDFAAFFGLGGVWIYFFLGQLRKRPLLPLKDPRLSPPIPSEAIL
jgi:hypothetical protein